MNTVVLEENQRLSQSLLWGMQRRFLEQQGIRAWSEGWVPHYATSNPMMARAYAQVVLGFLRDWCAGDAWHSAEKPAETALDPTQPVYIAELGAGSGRFAYHFLRQFAEMMDRSSLRDLSFTYLIADLAPANLDFCRKHPKLQPFLEQGQLDFVRFDAVTDGQLHRLHANVTLTAETLRNPLVVLANYFFDSIPQDVFTVRGGQLYESLLTLHYPTSAPALDDPELDSGTFFKALTLAYTDRPVTTDYYGNAELDSILANYAANLTDTTVMFPTVGLRCLDNLRQLARDRLLLLSADKGYSRLGAIAGRGHPRLTLHGGCFSFSTNYHALAEYTAQKQGEAHTLPDSPVSLNLCAFLFGHPAEGYLETGLAYQQAIVQGGPSDFFGLKKAAEQHYEAFSLPQLIGYLRLSQWDANIFFGALPTLLAHAETVTSPWNQELIVAIGHLWQNYYFIGEKRDMAAYLAQLLHVLGRKAEALTFYSISLERHGPIASTFYNMALCYQHLGQVEKAQQLHSQALTLAPNLEMSQRKTSILQPQRKLLRATLPAGGYRLPIG